MSFRWSRDDRVLMQSESLSLGKIVQTQATQGWFFLPQFIGFLISLSVRWLNATALPLIFRKRKESWWRDFTLNIQV